MFSVVAMETIFWKVPCISLMSCLFFSICGPVECCNFHDSPPVQHPKDKSKKGCTHQHAHSGRNLACALIPPPQLRNPPYFPIKLSLTYWPVRTSAHFMTHVGSGVGMEPHLCLFHTSALPVPRFCLISISALPVPHPCLFPTFALPLPRLFLNSTMPMTYLFLFLPLPYLCSASTLPLSHLCLCPASAPHCIWASC